MRVMSLEWKQEGVSYLETAAAIFPVIPLKNVAKNWLVFVH